MSDGSTHVSTQYISRFAYKPAGAALGRYPIDDLAKFNDALGKLDIQDLDVDKYADALDDAAAKFVHYYGASRHPVNLFIAIEDGYQRKTDVLVQSDLAIRHANVLPSHELLLHDGAPIRYYPTTTGATAVIHFNEDQPRQEQDIYGKLSPFAKMVTAHLLRQRGLEHTLDALNAE